MFFWTEETIRWYCAAVEWTGFARALADRLQPWLPAGESVCDLGCGVGFLALELAERGYGVTALDCSAPALERLERERERRKLDALKLCCADWNSLPSAPRWDRVILVCAGAQEASLDHFRRLCRKELLVVDRRTRVSHARPDGGVSARRRNLAGGRPDAQSAERWEFALEFGQPLTSLEDARAYLTEIGTAETAERMLSSLRPTGDASYPWYLPYRKELELLVFPALPPAP